MADRTTFELRPAGAPETPVRVFPVRPEDWRALREEGAPHLRPGELAQARRLAELARFAAKPGQSLWLTDESEEDGGALLVGRGAKPGAEPLREAAAASTEQVPEGVDWSFVLPDGTGADDVAAAAEGLLLGSYRYRAIGPAKVRRPGPCALVGVEEAGPLDRARALVEGQLLTRDLVNASAEALGPEELADAAADVARRHGMGVSILRGPEVLAGGFRLVDAVGRASSRPATVTVVEHGLDGRAPELALIGKGVVFDSGGLGIKTAGGMKLMRKDMGGAGTVIGALDAVGRLGLDLPILAVLPSAENSIGPAAFRPGDVFEAYDGQTVEIGHTDAEGRLLLADAIGHAREREPARLLDVATLTGAARVALGPDVPALFGNDEDLVARVLACSGRCGEPFWRLPLVEAYEKYIDSPWADVNNSSSDRRGGAITAALFLRRFVGETPWAHVDLNGWEDSGRASCAKGANGMAVRTLATLVEDLASG